MNKKDILALIKRDHEDVQELFEKLSEETDKETAYDRFSLLKQMLLAHTIGEEKTVYQRLEQDTSDEIREYKQEHGEAEELLNEMENAAPLSEEWQDNLDELKQIVLHHVQEEEGEFFKRVEDLCDEKERQELGEQFEQEKETFKSNMKEVES